MEEDQQQHNAGDHLQRKGDPPDGRVVDVGDLAGDSVVDKVRNHDARNVEELHTSDTAATNLTVDVLADICRDNSADQAYAEATNEPAGVELAEAGRANSAARLYNRADEENQIG